MAAGAGLLFQGRGKQTEGFVPEQDVGQGGVTPGSLLWDPAHRPLDRPEGRQPLQGAPALGSVAGAMLGQPGLLQGGKGPDIELPARGPGTFQEGARQVMDVLEAPG